MAGIAIEDRVAITDAIHSFFYLVDSGRASQTADMFAADARLTFGPGSPQPGTIEGATIGAAMEAREAMKTAFTRHAVANIRFAANGEEVAADYLLTLFRSDDESRSSIPAFVADVAEIWRRDASAWLICERTITPAFARP